MEAALLGGFMVSACLFSVVLFHPGWPAARLLPDPLARRALMGLAMGATAIALNYSAWGKQSGAHYNPAVTLTFTRLGKVDALGCRGLHRRPVRGRGAGRPGGQRPRARHAGR